MRVETVTPWPTERLPRRPRVLNRSRLRAIPPDAVYVGRGRNGSTLRWGNPFNVEFYGRARAIEKYKVYIQAELDAGRVDLAELRGKDLVCWCAPLPCHADHLLELANGV